MKLTTYEQQLLDGLHGQPQQQMLEYQIQFGQQNHAKRMVAVGHVFLGNLFYQPVEDSSIELAEHLLDAGARFQVPTTLRAAPGRAPYGPFPMFSEEMVDKQQRLAELYIRMGAIPCAAFPPADPLPALGQHLCWSGPCEVTYVNAILGARSNHNDTQTAVAAALTGVTPEYGYHWDAMRRGTILVEIDTDLENADDYYLLGCHMGKRMRGSVPVFTQLPEEIAPQNLIALGAGLGFTGQTVLFHIVGITPEAPTMEAAFGGNISKFLLQITREDLEETRRAL